MSTFQKFVPFGAKCPGAKCSRLVFHGFLAATSQRTLDFRAVSLHLYWSINLFSFFAIRERHFSGVRLCDYKLTQLLCIWNYKYTYKSKRHRMAIHSPHEIFFIFSQPQFDAKVFYTGNDHF